MLDIRLLRENPDVVKKDLGKRDLPEMLGKVDEVRALDKDWRYALQQVEELRRQRNVLSREIAELKKAGKDTSKKLQIVKDIPGKIKKHEEETLVLRQKIDAILLKLPNILDASVPVGADEAQNVVVKKWGKASKRKVMSHVDWTQKRGLVDTEKAAKISGSRFYYLQKELVLLELSLVRFGLDFLQKRGYLLIEPPFMMRREPYLGVTDLEAFEDVLYKIEGENLYLIATSEHPICAFHMDEVIDEEKLPIKYAGYSTCFRREAGSHGKDTKGIFRVHQFNKIEQFIFSHPKQSWNMHEELLRNSEEIYQKLGLPYRVVNVCTGDIGSIAAKKYDLEVWMPAQSTYREAVSCSNCTGYQARRLNIKFSDGKQREFVHTLNSTAIATTRTMVAIIENFQNKDGSLTIPKVLQEYMGMERIK